VKDYRSYLRDILYKAGECGNKTTDLALAGNSSDCGWPIQAAMLSSVV